MSDLKDNLFTWKPLLRSFIWHPGSNDLTEKFPKYFLCDFCANCSNCLYMDIHSLFIGLYQKGTSVDTKTPIGVDMVQILEQVLEIQETSVDEDKVDLDELMLTSLPCPIYLI